MSRNAEALEDLNKSIALDQDYLKVAENVYTIFYSFQAYLRRAAVHQALENFQEAVYDLEHAKQMDPTNKGCVFTFSSLRL